MNDTIHAPAKVNYSALNRIAKYAKANGGDIRAAMLRETKEELVEIALKLSYDWGKVCKERDELQEMISTYCGDSLRRKVPHNKLPV